ncbi:lipase/thioesterase family protein [Aspergillus clavatus NRRL 1]|uniref:Lipase/thioesterase family protein n=1 Tax=Aspergillus clavatus (strain ATCC 1007 / CBS 513.65 / DSM 816 / NCTC 3887 / NRRL 1 / QM 1276 / 107) TaxID=344612 RepID=A1C8F9_ASPCL|nr:lipase/thioesterase family protein [Aspergillus clavatus NRRL 1]EAW13596.1 lipase/thioesterase family protein [Aspergillus clavatus NRRL 1]
MAFNKAIKLSLREKLDFFPALVSIWITAVCALATGLWRSSNQPKTLFLHIGYAVFRKMTARLYVTPPSNKIYEQYIKKTKRLSQTIELGKGSFGHWIGDANANNVLIWYHGGGFVLSANMGYFKYFANLVDYAAQHNQSLAIFSLTYTLAPQATYPTQLRAAVNCLRYILDNTALQPSRIFLGGDSAGGNLVGGVLSHLAHPHPHITPVKLAGNLAGAVMIAPWTLLDTEFPDREIDPSGDLITPAIAGPWARAYLGTATRDFYTDLSTAEPGWYSSFPVETVLICAGGNEILLPIIQDFAAKFKAGFPSSELFVGRREGHVAPIYNLYIGDTTETEQGKRVKSWLLDLLS